MLHITNGQSAADRLIASDIPGEVLTWDDVLHVGAVPGGIRFSELRAIRAMVIANQGWSSYSDALQRLTDRDAVLETADDHDEVVLWFEHDLYDQLHILQILDQTGHRENLRIITVDRFPGIDRFIGLGQLSTSDFETLFPQRQPVSEAQVVLAQRAWSAFRAPDPLRWAGLLAEDTSLLPFLAGAVMRWLEELPDIHTGLTRTQQQLMDALTAMKTPVELFQASQDREDRPFMGDSSFFDIVRSMEDCSNPIVSPFNGPDQPIYPLDNPGQERWNGNWRFGTWWGGTCQGAPDFWAWDSARRMPVMVDPATF